MLYLDRVEEWDGSSLEAVAAAWRHGEVRLARGGLPSRFTPIAGVADAERAARATAPDGPLGGIVQLRIDASEDQRDNHAGGRWSTGQAAKRVARAIKRQRQRENVRNGELDMSAAAAMTQDWSIAAKARLAAVPVKREGERAAATAVARTVADMLDSEMTTERHATPP